MQQCRRFRQEAESTRAAQAQLSRAQAEAQRAIADSSLAIARADAEAHKREREAEDAARRAIQRAAEATRIAEVLLVGSDDAFRMHCCRLPCRGAGFSVPPSLSLSDTPGLPRGFWLRFGAVEITGYAYIGCCVVTAGQRCEDRGCRGPSSGGGAPGGDRPSCGGAGSTGSGALASCERRGGVCVWVCYPLVWVGCDMSLYCGLIVDAMRLPLHELFSSWLGPVPVQVRRAIESAKREADVAVALELQRIKAQEQEALEKAKYAKEAAEFDNEKLKARYGHPFPGVSNSMCSFCVVLFGH